MTTQWWAPGRATLIGDHTDYTGGWALPFALNVGVTATVDLTVSGMVTVRSAGFGHHEVSLAELQPGRRGWARYVEGACEALQRQGASLTGADVTITSDLPPGGGLASSAAVVCSVLGAVADAAGLEIPRRELVHLARQVETEYVGAPVGFMDPAVVMHAEAGHALLIDCAAESIEAVPLPLRQAGMALLVIDTGQGHQTAGAVYAERVAQCAAAAHGLGVMSLREVSDVEELTALDDVVQRRARHVVSENARVQATVQAVTRGDWHAVGRLMEQSHTSLRDDYEVSTPALDLVVDTALHAGAEGARLTGAGLGGSVVVLLDVDRRRHVVDAVARAFERSTLLPPRSLWVEVSEAAHAQRPQ